MAVRACTFLLAIALAHAFIDEAVDVIKLGKEIGEEVLNSWDILGKPLNLSGGVDLPIIRRRERIVLSRLALITRKIELLETGIEKTNAVAMLLAKAAGRGPRLELRLHEMADLLNRVASADREMREYVRLQKELERSTLEDFAEWCVSPDRSALPGLLERVHSLIAPPHKHWLGRGILDLALDDLQVWHVNVMDRRER
ncbi:jg7233 [Pararge aegeria aegeria]|uniref:Jg7233 protein n=1 Tax=Pararge aegeria aegeria TaxID=348720 RepID=A0A8S4S6E2_9NEOP|nr:jg7233 [Pararge aegeria aegeria]